MRAADAAPESPPKGGSPDEGSSPKKVAAKKGGAGASDEDFESFPAPSGKNANASASQDEPPPPLPPLPPLLPPPPPPGWRWPREGDRVEIEVEEGATLWRPATVVSVISSGPETGWFSARMLHDDEWVDWFTWQEEGKDWRRTGGKRKLSVTASEAAAGGGDVGFAARQAAAAAERAGRKASKKPAKRAEEVLLVGYNDAARADEHGVHEDNDQDGVDRCGDDVSAVEPAESLDQSDENVDGKGTAAEVKVNEEAGGRGDVGGGGRSDGGGESDVGGGSRLTAAQQEELVEVINAMKRRGVDNDTTVHGWRVRFKTRSCQTSDGRRKGDWTVTTPSDETYGRQHIHSFLSLQRCFDGAAPARPRLLGLSPRGPAGSASRAQDNAHAAAPAVIGELNGIAIHHAIILEILAHAPASNVPPPATCAGAGMRSAWAKALRQHASEAQQCQGACGRPFCIVLAGALTHVADCGLHKPCRICEGAREAHARLAQAKAAVEAASDADASAPAGVAAVAEDASSGSTSDASAPKSVSSASLGEARAAVCDGVAIAVAEHGVTSMASDEPEPEPGPDGELEPEEEMELEASRAGPESVPSAVPSAKSTDEPNGQPVPLAERSGPWLVGDRVEARYGAQTHGRGLTKWYLGSVIAAHSDCTYDILYDDGDSELQVPARFVRDARLSAPVPNRKSARAAGRLQRRDGLERPSHPASRNSYTGTVGGRSELKQSRWQAKADEPPPPLVEIAELLTLELRVSGTTLIDKVEAGCFRLGIDTHGKTVAQKAAECWAALGTQATEFMREVEASLLPPPAAPPACRCIPPRPASFWRDRWWCDAANGTGCGLELRVPETPFTPLCRCQPSRPMRWVLGRWWCAIAADTNDAAKGCGHELPPDRPSAHPEPTLLRRAGSEAQPIEIQIEAGSRSRSRSRLGSSARALRRNGGPLEKAAAASTAALLTATAYGPMNAASFVAPFSSPSPPVVAVVAAHAAAAAADAAADTSASSELVMEPAWLPGSQRPPRPPPSAAVFEGSPDGGLGLFARTRLKEGDVIGELSGPRVPFWLLDTTVLRMKQPVCPWWLEAPSDHGARGRSAASLERKTAHNNALKRASAFFVDGTRQLEPLLRSLVSAKPLLECLVAAAPANESLNSSPHLASTREDAPAAPSSRTIQFKSDVTGSVIQGPLTQLRWPATFARISTDYCNATTKTQVVYNGSKGETRLWLVADRDIERGEAIGVDPACCSVPELDASARGRPSRKVVNAKIPRAPETMTPPELGRERLAKLQRISGMRLERLEHDADDGGTVIDVCSDDGEEVCGAEPVPAW